MIYHCLFEQSGTFKNVFKAHGHRAYDYDILNHYGQTDFQIDLFQEIDAAFDKLVNHKTAKSIFDNMSPENDFIIAFFPCTFFSHQNELVFQGYHNAGAPKSITQKEIEFILNRDQARSQMYARFLRFCFVAQELKIPTIIENPFSKGRNYLTLYSPYRPTWIDYNRSLFGDDKIKPTMFFSINFAMDEKFIMYQQNVKTRPVYNLTRRQRSEISPVYAELFYERFLDKEVQ